MWHHVGDAPTAAMRPYAVSEGQLAEQLDAVRSAGYQAVTFDDLRKGTTVERPVVLTFDDGYRSFGDLASPALLEREMRAVLFVVAGALGGVNDWDPGCRGLTLLDADGVWQVARDGHELGVHAWRHRPMTGVASGELERELLAARAVLEELGGRAVRSMSYPNGEADPRVIELVRQCGFDVACLDPREPEPGWPAQLGLTRVEVRPDTDTDSLLAAMAATTVDIEVDGDAASDPFTALVHRTLAAGDGLEPAVAWGAVHAVSGTLLGALDVRGVERPDRVFTRGADVSDGPGRPLARVVAPVASRLDERVDAIDVVPVWGVATPEAARDVDVEDVGIGLRWCDPARLFWQVDPAEHGPTVTAYLRAAGLRHRRGAVRRALADLAVSESAMLLAEALERGDEDAWVSAERSFTTVDEPPPPPRLRAVAPTDWRALRLALVALGRQDLRERYRGAVLGAGWAIVQPLLTFAVLAVFFGRVLDVRQHDYAQFLLAGLLPWVFLQRTVGEAADSVRSRGFLLRLAAFPRVVLPLATAVGPAVDLLAQLLVVVPIVALTVQPPAWHLVLLAPALALLAMLALALGIVVAGLGVRYRDVGHLVPLLTGLAFYAVPVVYAAELIPGGWRIVYRLNPAVPLIELFRASMYGGPLPPLWSVAWAAAVGGGGLLLSWRWFAVRADEFAAEA